MHLIGYGFIGLGLLFFFGTAMGLIRFPDAYTRAHAAGKGDTLSSILLLVGLIVYQLSHAHHVGVAEILVAVKMLLICAFIFIGSPTAAHAIMRAAYRMGLKPWQNDKDSNP